MLKKKISFVFVFFIFVFSFKVAGASVIINEVQVGGSSATDEFIELYNDSSSDIDLTNWFLKKRTSSGAEYSLVAASRLEGKTILAGGYFLVVNENGYVGNVPADATWASSNTIANNNQILLYSLSDLMDMANLGTATDGKSFQKINSSWVTATPTPKALNQNSSNSSDENSGSNNEENNENTNNNSGSSGGSSNSSGSQKDKPKVKPTFRANILAPTLAFAGQPIEFNLDVKYGDETYACGKYFWNFGDGDSKKVEGGFEKFTHTYYYPGEYNVSLEYFKKKDSVIPEITVNLVVKVVPLTVSISNVGDYKDFFIELTNNANYKIDVSNWILSSGGKNFSIPKNTVITAENFITIPGRISGFMKGDEKDLKLIMPNGEVVYDFNSKSAPVKRVENNNSNNQESEDEIKAKSEKEGEEELDENSNENKNKLASAPILSGLNGKYLFIFGLFAFLCVGALAIYFVRRKSSVADSGDGFEAVDE
ncbi:MAG TPA: lamin tail domain-containing protein [Candidatus Paceibacterota bacterium]|nr:lamin tail domain-containing protein [Candidatus Paceibacterota bacterium]